MITQTFKQEYKYLRENKYLPGPRVLQIEITNKCCLNCPQCYKPPVKLLKNMTLDDFKKHVDISGINGGLGAIGLGLLVLFFAMSIFKSTASFRDFQRPEYALKHFIRFCAAKVAITYVMDLMTAIYTICGGIVEQIAGSLGGIGGASVTLPAAIEQAVEDTGFWASIPLWLVTDTRLVIHNGTVIHNDYDRVRQIF